MAQLIATNFGEYGNGSTALSLFTRVGNGNPTFNSANYANFWANGNGCAITNVDGSVGAYYIVVPSQTEYFLHTRYRRGAGSQAQGLLWVGEGSTNHIDVIQNLDGTISARRNGTVLATGATIFGNSAGTILSVQLHVVISDTVGVVQVRINGSTSNEIDFSGDTRNGGAGVITSVGYEIINTGELWTHTDFIVNDTTGAAETSWTGAARVVLGVPNANGASGVQWTPSAGSNFQNVDDAIPGAANGDTDYNESATPGQIDYFAYPSSIFTGMSPASIKSVRVKYVARAADGGSHTMRSKAKDGGTTVNGTTINLASNYPTVPFEDVYHTDPATGAAWATFGAITGSEFGYELIS